MNKIRILILMTTFNGEKWIFDQILSILNQVDVSIKILISDDQSSDRTLEIIDNIKDPRIEICDFSNSFGSAGANFINLIMSTSELDYDYYAFSDQDDIWEKNKLKYAIQKIKDSNSHGYSSSVNAFWPNGKVKKISQSSKITGADFLFEGAGQGCTFLMSNFLFNKSRRFIKENYGLLKDFYYHDWLIYIICRCSNLKWFFDETPYLNYRQHSSNDTGAKNSISSIYKRLKLLFSGWYKNQVSISTNISIFISRNNLLIKKFGDIFNCPDSINRRYKLCKFIFNNGRRKKLENLILIFFAVIGKI